MGWMLAGWLCAGLCAGCAPAGPAATPTSLPAPTPTLASRPSLAVQATLSPALPVPTTEGNLMNEVPIPTPFNPLIQSLVDQARADLAQRLKIDPSKIEVAETSEVTWPDSSLGCPQPGMAYAQRLVEGVRLRLRVGQQIYPYHSASGRPPFLCEQRLK